MRKLLIILFLTAGSLSSVANNLQISDLKISGNQSISFNISWENSWALEGVREPYNHDAAWLFLKYKNQFGEWHHLDLSSLETDHNAIGCALETVADGKGIFVKRNIPGSG